MLGTDREIGSSKPGCLLLPAYHVDPPLWPKNACLKIKKRKSCALSEKNEVFDVQFTLLPTLPGKRKICIEHVNWFHLGPFLWTTILTSLFPQSLKPWIKNTYNCLSVLPFTFFSLIHIYAGLIHKMGLIKLKPKKLFFPCRLASVSLGFCCFASDCSAVLFSPLQLAGLHVNMVKKNKK